MDTISSFAPLIGALITAVVGLTAVLRSPDKTRAQLKTDGEILSNLPPDSASRQRLLDHMEGRIDRMISVDEKATRDLGSLAMAIVVAPALVALAVWLVRRGDWLAIVGAVLCSLLAAVMVYGIFESAQKVERDAKGFRIDPQ